jgi:hypothetical protein
MTPRNRISRRELVGGGAVVVGGGVVAGVLGIAGDDDRQAPAPKPEAPLRLRVLKPAEAALVAAMRLGRHAPPGPPHSEPAMVVRLEPQVHAGALL